MMLDTFTNNIQTLLDGSIDDSQTTLDVVSVTGFPTIANFRIVIEQELLLVTSISGNTFTVQRGMEDTTAVLHNSGKDVTHVITRDVNTRWQQEIDLYATITTTSDTEFFIDAIANSRLNLPDDSAWTFLIHTIAKNTSTNETCAWLHVGTIEKNGSTTDIVGSVNNLFFALDAPIIMNVTADDTNDSLKLSAFGVAYNTWKFHSKVHYVEVTA
ncbi:MAG: hypothetical protein KGZ39_05585 [Simkania sp.]|nr:hypothetical protein [Simkania sp.]